MFANLLFFFNPLLEALPLRHCSYSPIPYVSTVLMSSAPKAISCRQHPGPFLSSTGPNQAVLAAPPPLSLPPSSFNAGLWPETIPPLSGSSGTLPHPSGPAFDNPLPHSTPVTPSRSLPVVPPQMHTTVISSAQRRGQPVFFDTSGTHSVQNRPQYPPLTKQSCPPPARSCAGTPPRHSAGSGPSQSSGGSTSGEALAVPPSAQKQQVWLVPDQVPGLHPPPIVAPRGPIYLGKLPPLTTE